MSVSRPLPLVSVVIPNRNGAALLEPCLRSLSAQTHTHIQIIIVDNASDDDSVAVARRIAPDALVLRQDSNLGFAEACNRGMRAARGEWIALLNNDTEAAPDWIGRCLETAGRHPEAAFIACRVLDHARHDRIYSAGDCFLRGGIGYRRGQEQQDHPDYHGEVPVFSAGGCAALFRRTVLENAGGFDPDYFAYLEDVDLGLRLQTSGLGGWYTGAAVVSHRGGSTSGGEFSPLAVRLRTRNSLFLLGKCLPAPILRRCLPMILATQLGWLARAAAHGRFGSCLHGWAQAFARISPLLRARRRRRDAWRHSAPRLWQMILESESAARADLRRPGAHRVSTFLNWYFRIFR